MILGMYILSPMAPRCCLTASDVGIYILMIHLCFFLKKIEDKKKIKKITGHTYV